MHQVKSKIKQSSVALADGALRVRVLHSMTVVFGVLVLFYLIALSFLVWNVIERKALEAEARILSNEVGELELAYLEKSAEVDLDFSYALGFVPVEKDFAGRVEVGYTKNSTLASNEI